MHEHDTRLNLRSILFVWLSYTYHYMKIRHVENNQQWEGEEVIFAWHFSVATRPFMWCVFDDCIIVCGAHSGARRPGAPGLPQAPEGPIFKYTENLQWQFILITFIHEVRFESYLDSIKNFKTSVAVTKMRISCHLPMTCYLLNLGATRIYPGLLDNRH